MKITEVYERYQINHGLQQHMLQVAALAKMVCDHGSSEVDVDVVVSTCLVHDLGNLVKVKFDVGHTDHFEPEGVEYWKARQAKVWQSVGTDEHEVTSQYLDELGVSPAVKAAVNQIGLEKIAETARAKSTEHQIVIYADLRVGLHGIVSVAERMADIKNRYVPDRYTAAEIDGYAEIVYEVEAQLFTDTAIKPSDITDESTASIQKELLEWEIETN